MGKTHNRSKAKSAAVAQHAQGGQRLVVVSIDGLRADLLRRPDDFHLKIPALRRLMQTGASAEGVESVFPSTTYPAHATLVTGVPPRVHGIYSHLDSRDPSEPARPWHWFAHALKVPTLWDAARQAGLKTASVGWPVSAGAAIDFNIPEIWDPAASDPYQNFEPAVRNSTPGLFEEVRNSLHDFPADATHDYLRTQAALHIWRQYAPALLLIHLVVYDDHAHHFGPLSSQALAALENSDEEIARVQQAIGDDVTFVVLSDHGFLPVEKDVAAQVALADEGLFGRNGSGSLKLKKLGAIHAGGSFAVYWLKPPSLEDREALDRAMKRIEATGAIANMVDRLRLSDLDADPDAEFIFDAAPGFYFSDRNQGSLVLENAPDHGAHGHLPSQPGLEACFIVTGSGVRAGKNLGQVRLTRIAPTLAEILNLPHGALATRERSLDLSS